jgi:hypothetical protein
MLPSLVAGRQISASSGESLLEPQLEPLKTIPGAEGPERTARDR